MNFLYPIGMLLPGYNNRNIAQTLHLSPVFPINPITFMPLFLADSIARNTFPEFPEVLIANKISPFCPNASTYLEKTKSNPISLETQLM